MVVVLLLVGFGGTAGVAFGGGSPAFFGQSSPTMHALPGPGPLSAGSSGAAPLASVHPFPAASVIALSPNNGTVGTAVVANGSGFLPSNSSFVNTVTLSWVPGGWVLCNVETNATGDFMCGFVVPNGVQGAHTIHAADTAANTATATFTILPTATLTPTSGLASSSASIDISGFAGNSSTTFVWAPTASLLCMMNTTATGDATCAFAVPAASSLGVHQITITDAAANAATVNFTVVPQAPTVTVVYSSPYSLYSAVPLNLSWTISSSARVNTETTMMWLYVADLGSSACPFISHGRVVAPPCEVLNLSLDSMLVNGTNAYAYTLTGSDMSSQNYNGGLLPYSTEYSISVFVTISTVPYVNGTTTGSVGIGGASQNNYLQTYLPSGTLISPDPNAGISTGNTSVVVSYTGDFVGGAVLNIYSGATSQLVYSAGVAVAGLGPHIGTAAADWRVTQPGQYTASLNLSGPFGYQIFTFALTVVPAGTTVYVNTSNYHNESLLGGLTPAVTASLLLLVGLAIGLAVALLLGRMMWGGTETKPPTPWNASAKPGAPGGNGPGGKSSLKPNECPICHQQFASASELADHQTKAHGTSPSTKT